MYDFLFAQSTEQSIAAWSQIVGSLGSAGFTGWLCWYLITQYIPKESEKNESRMEKARKDYKEDLTQQREHDAEQGRQERDACDKRHKELMDREEIRHQELLRRIDSNHMLTREISHGVKDIVHARGIEKAVAEVKGAKGRQGKPSEPNEDTVR